MKINYTRPKVLLLGDMLFKSGTNFINSVEYNNLLKNKKFSAYLKAGVLKIVEDRIQVVELPVNEEVVDMPITTKKRKSKKAKKETKENDE